jgi:hypothetical protein
VAGRGRSNADASLIVALAQGLTVAEAAAISGVAERTVYRRLGDAEFKLRISEAQQAIVERAVGLLAEGTVDAVHTLRKLSTEGSEGVQLRASVELLDRYSKLADQHRERDLTLKADARNLRSSQEAFTMEKALDMLREAGPDREQLARAWRFIEARMDSSIRWKFDAWLEADEAKTDWQDHRPAWQRHNCSE